MFCPSTAHTLAEPTGCLSPEIGGRTNRRPGCWSHSLWRSRQRLPQSDWFPQTTASWRDIPTQEQFVSWFLSLVTTVQLRFHLFHFQPTAFDRHKSYLVPLKQSWSPF